MKKLMSPLLGMFLIVSLIVVGTTLSAPPVPAQSLPATIVYGSSPTGAMAYTIGVALSKVISDNTPMKVEVLPQTWDAWAAMMETKEVDIGCGGGAGPGYLAYRGLGPYKKSTGGKGFDFNTVLLGGPLKSTYGAARDTDIRTLKDLKGKKVVTEYRAFLPAQITADVSLANAGLTREDLTSIPVANLGEGLRAVTERRADASITAIGAAMCEEWHRARGLRILPIDTSREALARGKKINPAYRPYTHKAGVYPYIEEPVITYVHDWIVVARTTLAENVVYEVLKAIWQNADKLPRFHALFREWNTAHFASTAAAAPYHPGAIKWFKEKGVWTSELEAYQKEMLGWK
jgi:TRAP transporter TAXI family solute receptor